MIAMERSSAETAWLDLRQQANATPAKRAELDRIHHARAGGSARRYARAHRLSHSRAAGTGDEQLMFVRAVLRRQTATASD